MQKVSVGLDKHSYDILIGHGLIKNSVFSGRQGMTSIPPIPQRPTDYQRCSRGSLSETPVCVLYPKRSRV